jgi:hypothetical protein
MKPGAEFSEGPPPAVIYCRVSDRRQTVDGDGLFSQEHRCRKYAAARGYLGGGVPRRYERRR